MSFIHRHAPDEHQHRCGQYECSRSPHTIVVPIVSRPRWADRVAHRDNGEPYDPHAPSLGISRSHAGGLTLHGQTQKGLIGVDMVAAGDLRTGDMEALTSLTRPHATPEQLGIRSLHDLGIWWAATEAAAKAWRGGLPRQIGRFQITLAGAKGAVTLWQDDALPPLRFHSLVLRPDLIGILATDRPATEVSMIAYEKYPTCVSERARSLT